MRLSPPRNGVSSSALRTAVPPKPATRWKCFAGIIASIDRQLAASRSYGASASASQSRSSGENFDDYIRGVDTVNDPYYGTSQRGSTEQYHWTDGYGTYRNSNDASYDPNRNEVGSWQLMTPTR